jgi:uncharacterized membrane protein
VALEDEREIDDAPGNDRLLALSDGVFAFAMTLLIIGIGVPEPEAVATTGLPRYILNHESGFFIWILSFLVIGLFWRAHHRLFRELRGHDETVFFLNLLMLLCVAFMPYPTQLIGRYGSSQFAVVLYSATMLLITLMSALISIHALRSPSLLRSPNSREQLRTGLARGLGVELVCVLSIVVSFFSTSAAILCYVLFPFVQRLTAVPIKKGWA